MQTRSASSPTDVIEQQALDWVIKHQSGEDERLWQAEFQQWLAADARHGRAYQAAARLWQNIGLLDELVFSDQMTNTVQPAPMRWTDRLNGMMRSLRDRCHLQQRLWAVGSALSSVMVLVLLLQSTPDTPTRYQTSHTGNQRIELTDGSILTLSGRSAVEVSFTKEQRRIQLLNGVAHFQVAKDPTRPFVVQSHDLQVKAIGTAFEVRQSLPTRVSVDEGRVQLKHSDPSNAAIYYLQAGERIEYQQHGGFSSILAFDVSQALEWREGRLSYHNTPLSEVIADVNRYRQTPIILSQPQLGQLPITASFMIEQSEELIAGLTVTHQIRVKKEQNRVILLQ